METNPQYCPENIGFSSSLRVGRKAKPEGTIVNIEGVKIGGTEVVIIAGPCAVESREQLFETARAVRNGGAKILRGGAFKPRSSPYNFQGLGEEGLKLLGQIRKETGLPVVTEVMDTRQVELVVSYADMIQIGSRNMQNYPLLKEAGMSRKPILLKRGMMAKEAVAVGADGLIIEVHYKPGEAICDGHQSLDLDDFINLMTDLKKIAEAVNREISLPDPS